MGILEEFKKFAIRGNVIDMAVGIIIGGAFSTIVKSLVADVIMPPIGLALGGVDFANLMWVISEGTTPAPYLTVADAKAAGAVTVNYGLFINSVISFVIVAFAVFMLVKSINKIRELEKKEEEEAAPSAPTTKDCAYCFSSIAIAATRCPHCTSALD